MDMAATGSSDAAIAIAAGECVREALQNAGILVLTLLNHVIEEY